MRAVVALEFIGENYWAFQREAKRAIREGRFYGVLEGGAMDRASFREGPAHRSKPWVACLTGIERDGQRVRVARAFVEGQIDYSRANGTGSRGVYLYFALTPGIYEVYQHLTWTKDQRYFIRVSEDGTYTEMPREEVETWLLDLRDQEIQETPRNAENSSNADSA